MSLLQKMLVYLGLGPDDEYEDLDEYGRPAAPLAHQAPPVGAPMAGPTHSTPPEYDAPTVRTMPAAQAPPPTPRVRSSSVRPLHNPPSRPEVIAPRSFNDAQEVADRFKNGQPVILNLQSVDRDLARRLIDFTSGLAYGLGGQMERVANNVYMLAPSNVEVSAEERRRLSESGLYES